MEKYRYDTVHIGHYTRDTIISSSGTRLVEGGGFNYGAHAAKALGLKPAAVTMLAEEDAYVTAEMEEFGIDVFAEFTPLSTCIRLEYPSENPDERVLTVESRAGAFKPERIDGINGRAFIAAPSFTGEMDADFIEALKGRGELLALDVQGFLRTVDKKTGDVKHTPWKAKETILPLVDFLKADINEAEFITGETDIYRAAAALMELGPKEVVLTYKKGILIYNGKEYYEEDFHPKEIIGRSGRGDTAISSYTASRLSMGPGEAIKWAAALTSLKMEKEGPFKGSREEVEEMIRIRYL